MTYSEMLLLVSNLLRDNFGIRYLFMSKKAREARRRECAETLIAILKPSIEYNTTSDSLHIFDYPEINP